MRGALPLVSLVGLFFASAGCTSRTCSNTLGVRPEDALECPAGELCYLGRCRQGCNAGREGVEPCQSDGDCGGARDRCVRGFCSGCDESTTCIPALDVCAPLEEAAQHMGNAPGLPDPNMPLDGGFEPGGIPFGRDTGVAPPPPVPNLTHVAQVHVTQNVLNVQSLQVAPPDRTITRWRFDRGLAQYEGPALEAAGCRLFEIRTATTSTVPADFGTIRIERHPDSPGGLAQPQTATFSGQYVISPPFGGVTFSTPVDSYALTVESAGRAGFVAAWPDPEPLGGLHIPYEVTPTPETTMQLANGVDGTAEVVLSTEEVPFVTDEALRVRVQFGTHEIECTAASALDGLLTVRIPLSILDEARVRGAVSERLFLDRRSARVLAVPADPSVDVQVRVEISTPPLMGTIQF